jgi:uncharacterized protein YjbI with pentapeptide repeats
MLDDKTFNAMVQAHEDWLAGDPKGKQADFSGMDLKNHDFVNVDLQKANFEGADLEGIKFIRCNLAFVNFKDANLTEVIFSKCEFYQTNMQSARMIDCELREVLMSKTIMTPKDEQKERYISKYVKIAD